MIKTILTLLLINPTTGVETQRFVIVDTPVQCAAMLNHVDRMKNDPQMRENHRRNNPGGFNVVAATCNQIDLTRFQISRPLTTPHGGQ